MSRYLGGPAALGIWRMFWQTEGRMDYKQNKQNWLFSHSTADACLNILVTEWIVKNVENPGKTEIITK